MTPSKTISEKNIILRSSLKVALQDIAFCAGRHVCAYLMKGVKMTSLAIVESEVTNT
jgi:hypothetical protein